jgi:hypothetical protein
MRCPSCGHDGFNPESQCVCGYHADNSYVIESFVAESDGKESPMLKEKSLKTIEKPESEKPKNEKPKSGKPSEEVVIKEIDSWAFNFSSAENCIYLGTPALQAFKLKLEISDLEELLEFMYMKTGEEKTMRKLRLSAKEINDVIDNVHRMVEEKKSKIALKFSGNELLDIANLINNKLKV